MDTISVFSKGFSVLKQHTPLVEMLNRIKTGYYAVDIKMLRKFYSEGDKAEYDKRKRQLVSFTVSADFDGRRVKECIKEYIKMMVLDFDGLLSDLEVARVKQLIILCNYTFACFVSPSGHGLKVLVRVSTDLEDHLMTFLSVQQYYSALTNLEIDPSGKDVTRLCFVSDDPELYLNPDSTVFVPIDNRPDKKVLFKSPEVEPLDPDTTNISLELPEVQPGDHAQPKATPKPFTQLELTNIARTYQRCISYVQRYHCFLEGHRHSFVYNLAMKMRKCGLTEDITTTLLLMDYNFDEKEVLRIIKDVYACVLKPFASQVQFRKTDEEAEPADDEESLNLEAVVKQMMVLPTGQEYKKGKEYYDLAEVEKLLNGWFETHYNEIKGVIEWRHENVNEPFQPMTDRDENSMFRHLYYNGQIIPINVLHNLLMSDFSANFDVYKSYFDGLPDWDGVTDYIGQLCKTVKTEDDKYWDFCFRKWYVSLAASLIVENVINHTVIVFVGVQGLGKSSWVKLSLPKEFYDYFGTAVMQADSKDAAIQLAECALIIMDELETLNKKDLAAFKELITRQEIRIRRPYGRIAENLRRRASFIASVNFEQILTDTSGSRRYLCHKVTSIDYQHTVDIDGCMAQAIALYRSGFKHWFDQDEIRELNVHNKDFMVKSIEEELITIWLRPATWEEWENRASDLDKDNIQLLSASQIAMKISDKVKMVITDGTLVKIGKVMSYLKFEKKKIHGSNTYLVRLISYDSVEQSKHSLEDDAREISENEAIIRLEEDLSGGYGENGMDCEVGMDGEVGMGGDGEVGLGGDGEVGMGC